jgi:hypothetical protein
MYRLPAGEQVDANQPSRRFLAGMERLDLVIPYELKQFVSVVETHVPRFSRAPFCTYDDTSII